MTMPNALAQMIGEAQDAPAFFSKESKIGDSIEGIISNISIRQTRDFKSKKPESWDDGSPKQQIVVIIDTTNSKGEIVSNSVYVKWWGPNRKAFASAVVEGGGVAPVNGGKLKVTFAEEIPSEEKGMDPQKIFTYEYTAPAE